MDGTFKCINVKFLAVSLCKGMSLFFKTHAMKIETKIYDSSGMLNLTTHFYVIYPCGCMYM